MGDWPGWKLALLIISFVLCPPLWLLFSLPINNKYNKAPIIKLGCYGTSHIYFMVFQCITSCTPIQPIVPRDSMMPYWNEWILLIWLSGLFLSELTNPQDRTGLGAIQVGIKIFSSIKDFVFA